MRYVVIFVACLFGTPLIAETIGTVEFQFPPSNHPWKLLSQEEADESDEDEDDDDFNPRMIGLFTHREGEALETFLVTISDYENIADAETTPASIQNTISAEYGKFLPNHKIVFNALDESKGSFLAEWELHDGVEDIIHGYVRKSLTANHSILLLYMTTARKTEMNRSIWSTVLNQANILE